MPYIIYTDENTKKSFKLEKNKSVTIGRGQSNVIYFPEDLKLSRHHCHIYYYPEQDAFVLADLHSTNGTFLNDNKILADVILSDGDKISIGDQVLYFYSDDHHKLTSEEKTAIVKPPSAAITSSQNKIFDFYQDNIRKSKKDWDASELIQTFQSFSIQELQNRMQIPANFNVLLKPNEKIDNYEIIRKIGDGHLATVYLAKDMTQSNSVALKIFHKKVDDPTGEIEQELKNTIKNANFSTSWFIHYYDGGFYKKRPYIVMNYLVNGNLTARIAKRAPFPEHASLELILLVAERLDKLLCQYSLPHGNLSPANILYASNDTMVLSDMGINPWISKYLMNGYSASSPFYISPEQISGESPDFRSDIYSLGIILFQILTGQLPFVGKDDEETLKLHITEDIPRPEEKNPNIKTSEEVFQLLEKMTNPDPDERFDSWSGFITTTKEILKGRETRSLYSKPILPRKKNLAFAADAVRGNSFRRVL